MRSKSELEARLEALDPEELGPTLLSATFSRVELAALLRARRLLSRDLRVRGTKEALALLLSRATKAERLPWECPNCGTDCAGECGSTAPGKGAW